MPGTIIHYYRETEASHSLLPSIKESLKGLNLSHDASKISMVETESCFNIQLENGAQLTAIQTNQLEWLLAETFEQQKLRFEQSIFSVDSGENERTLTIEFGPRMTFTSAFSSNAVSICQSCNLSPPISRLELSRRYRFHLQESLSVEALNVVKSMLHDRMTEQEYDEPITSFESGGIPEPVKIIDIMGEGRAALEKINQERGLGFDDFDLDYYYNLFKVRSRFISLVHNQTQSLIHRFFLYRIDWAAIPPM
jgi:phosphoribosylformylglycinamidine synthase